MKRVMVAYESKYGNTKLVAQAIVEGMRGVGGVETMVRRIKEVDFDDVPSCDVILIGSPNHIGRPTRSARKFIDEIGKLDLEEKQVAVFDTYLGKDFEKAVNKMERRINKKAPALKLIVPGLSIKVQGMKGPIFEEELLRCKDFGHKIASQIDTS